MKKTILAALVTTSLSATAATAATVNYDEAVDGDMGFAPFTLGAGVNTITGTAGPGDKDDFGVLFSGNLTFVSGTFSAVIADANININSSDVPLVGGGTFGGVLSPGNVSFSFADVASGNVFRVNSGGQATANYTFSFELEPSPVPLPASGMLLLGAVAGSAALRRRKSR